MEGERFGLALNFIKNTKHGEFSKSILGVYRSTSSQFLLYFERFPLRISPFQPYTVLSTWIKILFCISRRGVA